MYFDMQVLTFQKNVVLFVSEMLVSVSRSTYCCIQEDRIHNCHSSSSVIEIQTVKIFTSLALTCFHPA